MHGAIKSIMFSIALKIFFLNIFSILHLLWNSSNLASRT